MHSTKADGLDLRQQALGPMKNFIYLIGASGADEAAVIDRAWDVPKVVGPLHPRWKKSLEPFTAFNDGHLVEKLASQMGSQKERDQKDKSNKAENVKGIEGALGPGGLRGRVFGAAHGETEGFNSRSWGPPGQTSASRTSAVDLLDAVRQPARGSEGWAVVGGRMIREGS